MRSLFYFFCRLPALEDSSAMNASQMRLAGSDRWLVAGHLCSLSRFVTDVHFSNNRLKLHRSFICYSTHDELKIPQPCPFMRT